MPDFADNAPRAVGGLLLLGVLFTLLSAGLRAVGGLPARAQAEEHAADGGRGQGQQRGRAQPDPAVELAEDYGSSNDYEQLADAQPVPGA